MKESFDNFIGRLPQFGKLSPTDKILYAAWYLHRSGKELIATGDINSCFHEIHEVPPHTSVYLKRLSEKKPPLFLRSKAGFKLEGKTRRILDKQLESDTSAIKISSLLLSLVEKLSSPEEKLFLEETLKCYSVRAFRAAIVMAWILAYSHLERWLIHDINRIERFNCSYGIKFQKRSERILNIDSFAEFKEFDVIETAQHAKLISKNVAEIMKEKLKKRNAAAHPSMITITQAQVDDVITDLTNNVITKLG